MRLLICAGGSGGGVYPALSVYQAMDADPTDVLWVGGAGGMERPLVERENIPYTEIAAAGVHGVGLRTLPGNLIKLLRGFAQARQVIRTFKPDVMLFTGGYVAVPVALAGRRVPKLLYVPDIEPGLALKTLARFSDHLALVAEDSKTYFSVRQASTVTGHPVREDLTQWTRDQALAHFKLSPDLPVLLVFGGSKGARSINRAVVGILPDLLDEMQIVHLTGRLDWEEVDTARQTLSNVQQVNYCPMPYLHEMGAAYASADLILSRGGASAVGEFPLFGLPAILVPYPYAWRYQMVNAQHLAKNGAAIIIEDADLPAQALPTIRTLMRNVGKRQLMRDAMQTLAHPNAANEIAALLASISSSGRGRNL